MRTYFLGVSYPFCLEIETDKATERKEKDVLVTDALGGNNEDIVLSVGENRHLPMHHFETMGGLDCKSGLKTISRGDQRMGPGVCMRFETYSRKDARSMTSIGSISSNMAGSSVPIMYISVGGEVGFGLMTSASRRSLTFEGGKYLPRRLRPG